ncbi:MAG: hypothetical protein C5B50_26590 [Verrucomicrobia bacterium]|nr:MAG: hypothetical protein C5B50_26590 [Verrucomicrobiota bacterium]
MRRRRPLAHKDASARRQGRVVVLFSLCLISLSALADSHDEIVYRRFSRTPKPTPIHYEFDMKFVELSRPAIQRDVENGNAIFTFEGLGNRRIWKLPKCPMFSEWPAFGDSLSVSGGTNVSSADTSGCVCQAEELEVNGRWKRYFGWIGSHGATVVPAEQIYLWYEYSAPSGLGFEWKRLPGGTDWGMLAPDVHLVNGKYSRKQLNPGDPLPINIRVRNRCGVAKKVVGEIYRGTASGGPALRLGVTLHVAWAPFEPRTPDRYYPRSEDFRDLQPEGQRNFKSVEEGPVLEPGESAEGATFDLRNWFSCDRPGYYSFAFEFNPAELGLDKETKFGPGVYIPFEIGKSPPKLSAEELNKTIPALGGPGVEAKLKTLIREALAHPAATEAKATGLVNSPLQWAEPINGLSARIVHFDLNGYPGLAAFVELKNLTNRDMEFPYSNGRGRGAFGFELYTKCGSQPWNRADWFAKNGRDGSSSTTNDLQRKAETVTLGPGQTALACVYGDISDQISDASHVKMWIRNYAGNGQSLWRGEIETAAWPTRPNRELLKRYAHTQPMPNYAPEFNRETQLLDNFGDESEVAGLSVYNGQLLKTFEIYSLNQLSERLDKMMQEERDLPMKLLLASEGMAAGNVDAVLFTLACMKSTDYKVAWNTQTALWLALNRYKSNPPTWLIELVKAVLSDDRCVTGSEKVGFSNDRLFRMSEMPDMEQRLIGALGDLKCTNATQFLISRARETGGNLGAVIALGELGDSKAIPVLIELVRQAGPKVKNERGSPLDGTLLRPVIALGNLKAKEAVPLLLKYIQYPDVIEALEKIGDAQAVPALEQLVASGGALKDTTLENDLELQQRRLAAAKIALASLRGRDRTLELCSLLTDPSFGQYERRAVVWRLGDKPDARAVPYLAKAVSSDPSGAVVNQAIAVLSGFRFKSAVDALIAGFDADFNGKNDWKRAYKPEMFRGNIAESLRSVTGQSLGPSKEEWQKWWQEHRNAVPGLL